MLLAIENTSIRIEQFPPVHNFHKSQLDQCDRTDPPYQCNIIELSVCEGTPFPTVTTPTPHTRRRRRHWERSNLVRHAPRKCNPKELAKQYTKRRSHKEYNSRARARAQDDRTQTLAAPARTTRATHSFSCSICGLHWRRIYMTIVTTFISGKHNVHVGAEMRYCACNGILCVCYIYGRLAKARNCIGGEGTGDA